MYTQTPHGNLKPACTKKYMNQVYYVYKITVACYIEHGFLRIHNVNYQRECPYSTVLYWIRVAQLLLVRVYACIYYKNTLRVHNVYDTLNCKRTC